MIGLVGLPAKNENCPMEAYVGKGMEMENIVY
jgi:hypothetical protein